MIYRSYNSELLIATGLLSHVFNDIVLDRRKHGMNEKFNKPISAKDMVQKTIEVPCVYGQRSIILRSLENETGTYKLPLIILSGKSLKSDPVRNADIHVDVFYQQDEQFSKIFDQNDPRYRTYELSKRRGIPVTLQFDLTFVSKYREDVDQMITNWIVHFRPDIYVKWWHPRQKTAPLTSEILWDQNIGFESPIEFDVKNVYTHKATTTFTFKTWIFPGMNTEEDAIDPETEAIIKKFKFYPYRSQDWDENALVAGERDSNEETGFPVWGNLKEENIGDMGMWAVPSDSEFYINSHDDLPSKKIKDIKDGKYFVNNVFADSDPILSGTEMVNFKNNSLAGDFWSSLLQYDYPSWNSYQNYLIVNPQRGDNLYFSAVYFKGAMPQSSFIASPPSGDYLFKHFFNPYRTNILDETSPLYDLEFGSSLKMRGLLEYSYDIDKKTLNVSSLIKNDDFKFQCKSLIVSNSEIIQHIALEAVPLYSLDIKLQFDRSVDNKFNLKTHEQELINVKLYNDIGNFGGVQFAFEESNFKRNANNIIHIIKTYWNAMTLRNTNDNYFELVFESNNYGEEVHQYGLEDTGFTKLRKIKEDIRDGYLYEVLANNYLYFVLKTSLTNEEDSDIYDWWIMSLPKFKTYYAPIFVVEPEYARLVYGLNYQMSI